MKLPKLTRQATIDSLRDDDGKRYIEIAFSSEVPVERGFGTEILDHTPSSVDLEFFKSGRAPLLVDHDRTKPIGVVEHVSIGSDRVGRATVRFGKSPQAEEMLNDVTDGIRNNISVGYRINKMVLEGEDTAGAVYRATDWTPLEVSLVSVPADTSVGVGRDDDETYECNIEVKQMTKEDKQTAPQVQVVREIDEEAVSKAAEKASADAQKKERNRVADIMALASRHDMRKEGEDAIREGLSIEQFRGVVLDKYGDSRPIETSAAEVPMTDKEKRGYSVFRAIRAVADKNWKNAGFEREVSDAIGEELGREARGFFLPSNIPIFERNVTVGTTSSASYLKGTDHMGAEFIEALREAMVVRRLGALVLTGLRGDVAIPKMGTKTTVYWVAEDGAPTEGAPTAGQLALSPKTVAAYVDLSRKLVIQSDPSAEQVFRGDLVAQVARGIESVAINGGGTNEPSGILQTNGIGSVAGGTNGAAPTWANMVNLIKEVDADDGLMGTLAYLTNAKVVAKLRQTAKVSSTDSVMIMGDSNNLLGYEVAQTNLVPSNLTKGSGTDLSAIIFGNFRDLVIGEWGAVDVLVDPYSLSTTGALRITIFADVDVGVRHAESFSAMQDAITT